MNKLIPLFAFSILFLVPVGLNNAFAATIEITDEASCFAAGAGNFFVTSVADGCFFGSLTVNADDTLILENLFIQIGSGGLTNFGNVILIGGDEQNSGVITLTQDASLVNECGGIITAQGGDGFNSAKITSSQNVGTVTNLGTINLNGGSGQSSAVLLIFTGNTLNNHGTINENPGVGTSGTVVVGGFRYF